MLHLNISYDNALSESRQKQILQVTLLLIVALIAFVTGISQLSLTDPDESEYALISKNMIDGNNYLEPRLGDEYYADKPPLYFWLTAGSFKLFGMNNIHFSARIVPIIGAVLTVLATYLIATTLFNHALGMISGVGLISTVALIGLAKYVRMDIYLIAFITLALMAFIKGYKQGGPSKWYLMMYPFLAFAVLTKGPIGLFIPAGIIILLLTWQAFVGRNEWKVLGDMKLIIGMAIVIVIAGPWFIYMEKLHPGYAHEFFLNQNFNRAFQHENAFGHHNPLTTAISLLIGFIPWTGLVILAIGRYTRHAFSKQTNDWESRFLLLWFFSLLAMFSLSQTVLPNYVLPAIIPGMIITGRFVYDYWHSDFPRRRHQFSFAWAYPMILAVAFSVILLYLASACGAVLLKFHTKWELLPELYSGSWWANWGWLCSTIFRVVVAIILCKMFWYLWRNWQMSQLAIAITVAFLVWAVDISYTDLPRIADLHSTRRLVPLVRENSDASTIILAGPNKKNHRWSLPFYLGNTHPVRQIPNLATLTEYYQNTNQMLYLSTNDNARKQIEYILRDRTTILADYHETALILIKPKSTQSANNQHLDHAYLEARPEHD